MYVDVQSNSWKRHELQEDRNYVESFPPPLHGKYLSVWFESLVPDHIFSVNSPILVVLSSLLLIHSLKAYFKL